MGWMDDLARWSNGRPACSSSCLSVWPVWSVWSVLLGWTAGWTETDLTETGVRAYFALRACGCSWMAGWSGRVCYLAVMDGGRGQNVPALGAVLACWGAAEFGSCLPAW